ncbi:MAG: glycosyltransferase [Elusimicrobia bacterium]|nr:glycosyltransferase [Elusimicrobiota bacterium]
MKKKSSLALNIQAKLKRIKTAKVLVGIPSYNNEKTILKVLKTVETGLDRFFPDVSCTIMVSDGNSVDKTLDIAFDDFKPKRVKKICTTYRGISGKGMAIRAVMEAGRMLNSEVLMLFDADLRSIKPWWIRDVGLPLLKRKFDFIAPFYVRHPRDGTITNLITYPLTRALYGVRLRQPIGGDFGMRASLVRYFLDWAYWDADVSKFGIDIWMTTIAVAESFKISQCFLGVKEHDSRQPSQLGPMFRAVLSTSFKLMERYVHKWERSSGSEDVGFANSPFEISPPKMTIQSDDYFAKFASSARNMMKLWKNILAGDTYRKIVSAAERKEFDGKLWARVVYDFACVFHEWERDRFKLIGLITPFYYARLGSFFEECEKEDPDSVVERQAEDFEEEKKYLLKNWRY